MPKPRDYKAEYARRIARGMEKGMSRSQSAGHPRRGETPARLFSFKNPFNAIKETISNIVGEIGSIFRNLPSRAQEPPKNDVIYIEEHDQSGIRILPRWSVGTETNEPNLSDIKNLFQDAEHYRYQPSYAVVICGITEEEYPGKEGETEICLSYRIPRYTMERAMENKENRTLEDLINDVLPPLRTENWLLIQQVQVIDKD